MEKKYKCAYCEKEVSEKPELFCGKPCCEACREKLILMNKVESNKMLSKMNSRYIKHGILKYGSLAVFVIAMIVVFTADGKDPMWMGCIIAGISFITNILATLFRKKYKATMNLILREYKVQIHNMNEN